MVILFIPLIIIIYAALILAQKTLFGVLLIQCTKRRESKKMNN